MNPDSHQTGRLRAVAAGLAATALLATSALTAGADQLDGPHLGDASDFGVEAPPAPSIEEQLAHYGESVLKDRWLVELEGTNANRMVSDARAKGLNVKVRDTYSRAWSGVSVELDSTKAASLSQVRGVKGVYPVVEFTQPVEPDATPAVEYAKQLTGADYANDELGFTGDGIKVGIIDSGIDYNHPDFGGSGVNDETRDFPNDRVAYGYDFVGDAYDASSNDPAVNVPRPDPFPDDCGGHGTHVAGITGANGQIQGVAPDVIFGAYRVFGCDGSSSSDVIMSAMDRAVADGMDVINMSLGAAFVTWPSYPTAVAADRIVEDHGVVVVVSQGNSGVSGTFSGGAPAVAHNVIAVGSVDNTQYMADYILSLIHI